MVADQSIREKNVPPKPAVQQNEQLFLLVLSEFPSRRKNRESQENASSFLSSSSQMSMSAFVARGEMPETVPECHAS